MASLEIQSWQLSAKTNLFLMTRQHLPSLVRSTLFITTINMKTHTYIYNYNYVYVILQLCIYIYTYVYIVIFVFNIMVIVKIMIMIITMIRLWIWIPMIITIIYIYTYRHLKLDVKYICQVPARAASLQVCTSCSLAFLWSSSLG